MNFNFVFQSLNKNVSVWFNNLIFSSTPSFFNLINIKRTNFKHIFLNSFFFNLKKKNYHQIATNYNLILPQSFLSPNLLFSSQIHENFKNSQLTKNELTLTSLFSSKLFFLEPVFSQSSKTLIQIIDELRLNKIYPPIKLFINQTFSDFSYKTQFNFFNSLHLLSPYVNFNSFALSNFNFNFNFNNQGLLSFFDEKIAPDTQLQSLKNIFSKLSYTKAQNYLILNLSKINYLSTSNLISFFADYDFLNIQQLNLFEDLY